MEKLQWLWTNRVLVAAWLMAGLVAYTPIATFLARFIARPAPEASWVKRALYDLFIDTPSWVAALGHSGILGGLFSLPGIPSRPPEQNPTPTLSRKMRAARALGSSFGPGEDTSYKRIGSLVIPLALAAGLAGMMFAWAGCGTTGAAVGAALGSCELGALPKELEGVLASVIAAALTPAGIDWQSQLEQAAAGVAPAQGQCVIQAAAAWFESMSKKGEPAPAYAEARRRLKEYMQEHAPSASAR